MSQDSDTYFGRLAKHRRTLLPQIENLMSEHGSLPAGNGFIDVITKIDSAQSFINGLSNVGIAVEAITLWCDCSKSNKVLFGCPHGYGGPKHENGYYSEMCDSNPFDVKDKGINVNQADVEADELIRRCNQAALEYVLSGMMQLHEYSPCLQPGFWLAVPADWRRETYLVTTNA